MRRTYPTSNPAYFGTLSAAVVIMGGCDAISPPRRDPTKVPPPPVAAADATTESAPESAAGGAPVAPTPRSGVAKAAAPETLQPSNSPSTEESPFAAPSRSETASPRGPTPTAPTTPIRLSAGTALPQSLPTGTAMGFSVDYEFLEGGPQSSYQYVWVIRAAQESQPLGQPVRLQSQGTLQIFVPQLRPEQGPFETMIVEMRPDGTQRPVSAAVPLK